MTYTKKNWVTGEVIKAPDLNHIEAGIANADTAASTTSTEVTKVKSEVNNLKTDYADIDSDLTQLTTNLNSLNTQVQGVENDISELQSSQSELTASLDSKVTKVEGKNLSTNDFTDDDKVQLDVNTSNIATLKDEIESKLKNYTGKSPITLKNVNITNLDMSNDFTLSDTGYLAPGSCTAKNLITIPETSRLTIDIPFTVDKVFNDRISFYSFSFHKILPDNTDLLFTSVSNNFRQYLVQYRNPSDKQIYTLGNSSYDFLSDSYLSPGNEYIQRYVLTYDSEAKILDISSDSGIFTKEGSLVGSFSSWDYKEYRNHPLSDWSELFTDTQFKVGSYDKAVKLDEVSITYDGTTIYPARPVYSECQISLDYDTSTLGLTSDNKLTVINSGGSGTTDYTQLQNKPQINGVELTGNKTTSDLGIVIPDSYSKSETDNLLDSKANSSDVYNKSTVNTLLDSKIDSEKHGIQGDYSTRYGILDCPNGLISYGSGKDITINSGIILQLPGNTSKTTIASPITKTLTSTSDMVLFYTSGELLECGKVDYSVTEPEDNGVSNYQAWFNPELGKWQLKSNDTGNVWREITGTPIANIYLNSTDITRIDYIGYRILDDELYALKSDISGSAIDYPGIVSYTTAPTVDTAYATIYAGTTISFPFGFDDSGKPKFQQYTTTADSRVATTSSTSFDVTVFANYNVNVTSQTAYTMYYVDSLDDITNASNSTYAYSREANRVYHRSSNTWQLANAYPIGLYRRTDTNTVAWKYIDKSYSNINFNTKCNIDQTKVVNYFMPDYASGISLPTSGVTYTCPDYGYITVQGHHGASEVKLYINGVDIAIINKNVYGNSQMASEAVQIPVSKGDVVTANTIYYGYFFPLKGVTNA